MKAREFKRVWGPNYDYYFLLKLEQRKIKEMASYIAKHKRYVGWEKSVWEMNVCIQLIDIILEKDKYYESWLHNSFGKSPFEAKEFPVHVNIKNSKRFFKNRNFNIPKNEALIKHWIPELRRKKALYLYNKIRTSRMLSWWD